MTKSMKKILQYLLVAIFSLTLVFGVGKAIDLDEAAQAATTTQVTTVSSLDLSNQATAQGFVDRARVAGEYDGTEKALKIDLSSSDAMLYFANDGLDNIKVSEYSGAKLQISYQNRGAGNQPLTILLYGADTANGGIDYSKVKDYYFDSVKNMTSGEWTTIEMDLSGFSWAYITLVRINGDSELYVRDVKSVFTATTKIDLSDSAVANTYANGDWVIGSYDSTEEAIIANISSTKPAMFYRGPGGMQNLYIGNANVLEITYQIRTNAYQALQILIYGNSTEMGHSWDNSKIFYEALKYNMGSGQWVTLSLDISEFDYDFISLIKLEPLNNNTGEIRINSIEVRQDATTSVTDILTSTRNGENFILFQLSNNDYAGLDTVSANANSLFGYIDIDGTVLNSTPSEPYFNVWGNANTFAFRAPGHTAATLGQVKKVTVKAGAKFPSYNKSGVYYYATTEDVTFLQFAADDWRLGYTITYLNDDGSSFTTQSVEPNSTTTAPASNPTKANTLDIAYTFDGWYNGETEFDFSTPITSDLTLTAKYTESEISFTELETTVTDIHFGHNATFLSFTLSALDSAGTKELDVSILTKTNLLDKIEINNMPFKEFETRTDLNPHFDVYGAKDFSLRMRAADSIDDFSRIIIRQGAQFPSLEYVNGTAKTCYTVSEDVEFIVYYDGAIVKADDLAESHITVTDVAYGLVADTENFLIFNIDGSDYPEFSDSQNVEGITYAELEGIKFFDNITLKGTIYLGEETATSATFAEIIEANSGAGSVQPLLNHYYTVNYGYTYSLAIRIPYSGTMNAITSVTIAANTQFPSYNKFIADATDYDYRLVNTTSVTFEYDSASNGFVNIIDLESMDIWMEKGASVRLARGIVFNEDGTVEGYENSGLRFKTNVANTQIAALNDGIASGIYKSVSYGTLVVPTDYLSGGQFTHAWLNEHSLPYLDIHSTGWAETGEEYSSYYGSIVNLNENNYARKFSGIGYIYVTYADDTVKYFYAPYLASNARTSEYVAKTAIADRNAMQTGKYTEPTDDGSYSPFTSVELQFLNVYITGVAESVASSGVISSINTAISALNAGVATSALTLDDSQPLPGAYIQFNYELSVDMIATLNYSDKGNNKIVNEEVYLSHFDTEYKQFLDIFRTNGAGYGISPTGVYLHSISFKNVGTTQTTTDDKIISVEAQDRRIYDTELQQYLTRYFDDDSNITIGTHLGLGGALTYLAKSGLAEYSKVTTTSGFFTRKTSGRIEIGTDTANATTVYRTGADSLPKSLGGNGVNLINNFDVGRQIQQAYYADVADDEYENAQYGAKGYEKDWPYNPVQAGDQYNNTSQIIDYEINETEFYIYVKCRPLDWAQNNVTTKSYMENWYRLNANGTVSVENKFVEWSGYSDLGDYHSNELPAVYISQPMNYYVSNLSTDKNDAWTGDLTFNNQVGTWSNPSISDYAPVLQGNGANTTLPYGNHENWFAWANGGTMSSIGVGVYIPNTAMFTSGRAATTTYYIENNNTSKTVYQLNRNANVTSSDYCNLLYEKGLLSNMDPIDYEYMSCYVQNTCYTAPTIAFKMENYVPLDYSYVICIDTISNMRETFQNIEEAGTLTNTGLDAWKRNDKPQQ